MYPTAYPSGWSLLALVLFLTAYNLRKKLPFLPLLRSGTWLQLHIYTGLITAVLFVIHIGGRVPDGLFETTLASLYLAVFVSGIVGLALSRIIPHRLTTRGLEVLFERVPIYMAQLQAEVEDRVLATVSEMDTTAVPEFYQRHLQPFFERPRHFWHHVVHSTQPRQALINEIQALDRFLTKSERGQMVEIEERVKLKDDLDYQYSMQLILKYWLFFHIPLTYGLLVFAVFHILLVYAFAGGIR